MKCDEVLDRVDDFLDSRLQSPVADAVADHLAGCPVCSEEIEGLRMLRERVEELPREAEPARDLWPGIAARIQEQKVVRSFFTRRSLMATAAMALFIGSVAIAYMVGRSQVAPLVVAVPTPEVSSAGLVLTSFSDMGIRDYESTRDELLFALEARRHELSDETQEILRVNLELIDEAMTRIAEALGENPESELLMKQLAGAYRQQIGLLQRAVRLPAEV